VCGKIHLADDNLLKTPGQKDTLFCDFRWQFTQELPQQHADGREK
jgi:hypothetical protein